MEEETEVESGESATRRGWKGGVEETRGAHSRPKLVRYLPELGEHAKRLGILSSREADR